MEPGEDAANEGGGAFERAGRRELSPGERRVVGERVVGLWARLAAAALALGATLLAAVIALVFVEEAHGLTRAGLMALAAGLSGGAVALFLRARSLLGESRALGRDARRGYVQRYAGVAPASVAPGDEPDPRLRRLRETGLLKEESPESQWFEVLPSSGFLWQVNGMRPRRWTALLDPQPVEVAETPAFARIAAEWAEPVVVEGQVREQRRVGQRELSADEVRELRQHVRRALRARLVAAPLLNLWWGSLLGLSLRSGRFPRGFEAAGFWLLGAVTGGFDLLLARTLREARRYARDARIGRVVIVRQPLIDDEEPDAHPDLSVTIELLPVSGELWTIDEQPAWWRTAG